MTAARSFIGTEWERQHPGYYTNGTREIVRLASHRWELSGMVIDTETLPTLREAMERSDEL